MIICAIRVFEGKPVLKSGRMNKRIARFIVAALRYDLRYNRDSSVHCTQPIKFNFLLLLRSVSC